MDYRLEQLRFELRDDPSSRSFFKLGEHLRREGELDEAIEVLQTGLAHHPRYVAAWVSLGRALLAAGHGAEAATALDTALELDPGNAVAARAAGEAAVVNEEWVKAVKNLKLARGLAPQDDSLNERIQYVEGTLAELGQLEAPEMRAQATTEPLLRTTEDDAADDPFAVRATGDDGVWSDANDVFAADWVDDADVAQVVDDDQPDAPAESPQPFDVDAGVEEEMAPDQLLPVEDRQLAEDAGVGDAGASKEDVFEVAADELPPPDEAIDDPMLLPEPEAVPAPEPEIEIELEAAPESEPKPEVEEEIEPAVDLLSKVEEIPLPTLTLARLAIEQGDFELAEKTLHGVLASEPENEEATQLLESFLTAPSVAADVAEGGQDLANMKVRKLRRWLDAVRLASERLDS